MESKRAEECKVASVVGKIGTRKSQISRYHSLSFDVRGVPLHTKSPRTSYHASTCTHTHTHTYIRRVDRERNTFFGIGRAGGTAIYSPPLHRADTNLGQWDRNPGYIDGEGVDRGEGTRRTSNYLRSFRVTTSMRSVSRVFLVRERISRNTASLFLIGSRFQTLLDRSCITVQSYSRTRWKLLDCLFNFAQTNILRVLFFWKWWNFEAEPPELVKKMFSLRLDLEDQSLFFTSTS